MHIYASLRAYSLTCNLHTHDGKYMFTVYITMYVYYQPTALAWLKICFKASTKACKEHSLDRNSENDQTAIYSYQQQQNMRRNAHEAGARRQSAISRISVRCDLLTRILEDVIKLRYVQGTIRVYTMQMGARVEGVRVSIYICEFKFAFVPLIMRSNVHIYTCTCTYILNTNTHIIQVKVVVVYFNALFSSV